MAPGLIKLLVSSFSTPSGSILDQMYRDLTPEAVIRGHSQSSSTEPSLSPETQVDQGLSMQLNGALQRAGSTHRTGKTASAENLLDQSKDTQASHQHFRSRSSPIMEKLNEVTLPLNPLTSGPAHTSSWLS